MATLLKDCYNTDTVAELADVVTSVHPAFSRDQFLQEVFDDGWAQLELKNRMRRITECLESSLALSYVEALQVLRKSIIHQRIEGFMGLVFSDYVALFGLANWQESMVGLAEFTSLCSSEFAVRPFILDQPEWMMNQMMDWAHNSDPHIRRLASEGCRPRLPWAESLPDFKKNPKPIIPILERLKNDSSDYVRRSVANNLNDISKDHPELVLNLARAWYGQSGETDALIKHACRSLLKQGNSQALSLFGYRSGAELQVSGFRLEGDQVAIGEELVFHFVVLGEPTLGRVRLEYRVGYQKKRGDIRYKVFKISEGEFDQIERHYCRCHSLKQRSTRTHYPGEHSLTLIINGVEKGRLPFYVTSS